ncbi:MAG: FGGY-family carbohydrate kinase [Verrucomicrobia bacterium]|nr:FGGY-family carbohydrate kinase [Verrucomicrobiota bacterium]
MTQRPGIAIGIDVGTSGVRAVAMEASGRITATAATRLADITADHRDPQAWRIAFERTLEQVLAALDPAAVACLCVDGTSGTLLAVDASGRPLADPLMYHDPVRDADVLTKISRLAPRESAAHGATSGLAKALVLARLPGVAQVMHQADWIASHLSGRLDLTDENNALKTGYDPVRREWPEWIAATGIKPGLLPRVLPAGARMGAVSKAAAKRFGLAETAAVMAGTTDGCASFLATGATRPGEGVTALGSTLTVKLLSREPLFAPQFGLYSHRLGDLWLAGGASNTGGNVLRHFFDDARLAELTDLIDPASELGLHYYPLLKAGERFPINDPDLAPRMVPRPDQDHHFLQAMLEGMAEVEALAYQRLGELGAPALVSIRTVGGGARSAAWRGIRQRTLGVPLLEARSDEAAAGTARLALGFFTTEDRR